MRATALEPSSSIEPAQAAVRFVPGRHFFTDRLELPGGMASKDRQEVLSNHIESKSPFHLDQLAWGAFLSEDKREAFVYAALRDKLEDDGWEEWMGAPCVPTFAPFLGLKVENPRIVCVCCQNTLTLLIHDRPGSLPCEAHSVEVEHDELLEEELERVASDILRELPWVKFPVNETIFHLKSASTDWAKRPVWHLKGSDGTEQELRPGSKELSLADIRPTAIKEGSRKMENLSSALWFISLGSVGVLLALLFVSLFTTVWERGLSEKQELLSAQQSRVAAIESKQRNLEMFERGSVARLQPLAMLDLVNRQRPEGLYFSEVRASDRNRLQIEGMAERDGTRLVNEFRDQLKQHGQISSVDLEITRIGQGTTSFRVILEFSELKLKNVGEHS